MRRLPGACRTVGRTIPWVNTHLGDLALQRVPAQPKQPLRAWDAADEYVMAHLGDEPVVDGANVLLINDSFGALACGLRHLDPTLINESAAGRQAISENLAANGLEPVEVISMLDLDDDTTEPFDLVVIKVPKATAQLTDLLHRLRPHLHGDTRVLGAAMVKHLHSAALVEFESLIGPTTTSLAKKKARLVHATVDPDIEVGDNPWPARWSAEGVEVVNYGGGFSPSSLDIGTRALLENVSNFADVLADDAGRVGTIHAVDLGCGNGIIGLRMARDIAAAGHDVAIEAVDDSYLAIDATQASWELSNLKASVDTHHHHRLVEALDADSADLIVVNPPFHNDRVIGDETAWSMFTDSHRVLRPSGALVVVGNRHLAYHAKLGKIFGNCETIASTSKFVVLLARR